MSVGERVGMLVVAERLKGSKYLCHCDCGKTRIVHVGHFNTGMIKSCGCHRRLHGNCNNKKNTREYMSWANMIARCMNPTNKRYKDYGGKGIKVCESWLDFRNFYADMEQCPDGFQIDRINNNGDYEPGNCRWVSPKENTANRSTTRKYFVFGVMYTSADEAAKALNVSSSTIRAWCEGRKIKEFLVKKSQFIERFYPAKENCWVEMLYG